MPKQGGRKSGGHRILCLLKSHMISGPLSEVSSRISVFKMMKRSSAKLRQVQVNCAQLRLQFCPLPRMWCERGHSPLFVQIRRV